MTEEQKVMATGLLIIILFIFALIATLQAGVIMDITAGESRCKVNLRL